MNYLAHIYLSGNDHQCRIGGFIADAVKGKAYQGYPPKMREGILLHRQIDSFTDHHPFVLEPLKELRPLFGRYSVILPDLYFDHFLAADFKYYTTRSLLSYSAEFYYSLLLNYNYLPARIRRFLWHFIGTNRLYRYHTVDGICRSLEIMCSSREILLDPVEPCLYLSAHYEELRLLFDKFFSELQEFARLQRNDLSHIDGKY